MVAFCHLLSSRFDWPNRPNLSIISKTVSTQPTRPPACPSRIDGARLQCVNHRFLLNLHVLPAGQVNHCVKGLLRQRVADELAGGHRPIRVVEIPDGVLVTLFAQEKLAFQGEVLFHRVP